MVTNLRKQQHEEQLGAPSAPSTTYLQDDEISLYDIWMVIVRHKAVLITVLLLVMAAGIVYAMTRPTLYSYKTVIELGVTGMNGSRINYVDTSTDLTTRLKESYIPQLRDELSADGQPVASVTVSVPKGSNGLFILQSEGQIEDQTTITALHTGLVEKVAMDHGQVIDATRQKLQADRLLIESRLNEIEARSDALRVRPGLSNETALLVAMGSGYQAQLKAQLEQIDAQLAVTKNTQPLAGTQRVDQPLGPWKELIILLAAVLGLMLGVFMVFVVEFFQKAKAMAAASVQ